MEDVRVGARRSGTMDDRPDLEVPQSPFQIAGALGHELAHDVLEIRVRRRRTIQRDDARALALAERSHDVPSEKAVRAGDEDALAGPSGQRSSVSVSVSISRFARAKSSGRPMSSQ